MTTLLLRATAVGLLTFGSVNMSLADPTDQIECVQSQVNASGHDAGVVDGLWGQKTKNGLMALRDEKFSELTARIAADSAVVWCRELGLRDPALATHWPDDAGEAKLIVAGELHQSIERVVALNLREAAQSVNAVLGLNLSDSILLIVGADKAALGRELFDARPFQFDRRYASAVVDITCRDDGFATRSLESVSILCLPSEVGRPEYAGFRDFTVFEDRINHAVFKQAMTQLIGYTRNGRYSIDVNEEVRGPRWLLEGFSGLWASYATRPNLSDSTRRLWLGTHAKSEYANLEEAEDHRKYNGDNYEAVAEVAALDLEIKAGRGAGLKYFQGLSLGMTPEESFENAFGLTMPEYYSEFAL